MNSNFLNLPSSKKALVGISVCLLIISLTQPAFYTVDDTPDSMNLSSVGIFFLGWIGFLGGALESFFWLANPLYLFALYLFLRQRPLALLPSVAATVLALLFCFLDTFIANEGGGRTQITGLGYGYFLWVASLSILTLGIILIHIMGKVKSSNYNPL